VTESAERTGITLRELAGIPVTKLKGVGDARAKAFDALDIDSLLDLLQHYPRRYIDRTNEATIAELRPGEEGMVVAEVDRISSRRVRGNRSMVTAVVRDRSGKLSCTFFNQPWREKQLRPGTEAIFFGKLEVFRGARQMTNPVVDLIGDKTGRILPVYPQSEKARIGTWDIAKAVAEALRRVERGFADPVPRAVRQRFGFVDRDTAMRHIHEPESMRDVIEARRRLVFDELLRVQLALVLRKRAIEEKSIGIPHVADGALVPQFHAALPFPLTGAQHRAISEITVDMTAPRPMHRLLQGDVGAGKTLVALSALLVAVQGGHQGALMAPTEVLAEQHYLSVRRLVEGLTVPDSATLMGERPVRIALLTNRTTQSERKRLVADVEAGHVDIVVGTHALIYDNTLTFPSLGLVVVDEQHRFGVEQRAALRDRGAGERVPDVLVMTATPIPRTAAMTVYGDLDVSVLDELPPGRTPIDTQWARTPDEETAVWQLVRDEVAAGRQAYVVCPLIDESETLEVRSAMETFEELSAGELYGLRLELLHGRMPSAEKEDVMTRFRAGEVDVLVSTTVIEVGVDVPNATVMVILDAARFGIAQLHQLRGRVGRGVHASHCRLVGEATTPDGEARLEALVKSTDGFELAEIDLDLRGEGTVMGERQKGQNDLRLASLRRDREWVEKAREVAFELVDHDGLASAPGLRDEITVELGEDAIDYLMKS
jgi:ATP-dependent DNA helicase RecG